jgi:hypothetical protein
MGRDDFLPTGKVAPVVESNDAVIAETPEVSERHTALHPFGITLLHSHFDMEPDEELIESVDLANWVITMRPVRRDQVGPDAPIVPTGFVSIAPMARWWLRGLASVPKNHPNMHTI